MPFRSELFGKCHVMWPYVAILCAGRYYIPQEGGKNIQKQKGHRSELDVGEQDMESLLAQSTCGMGRSPGELYFMLPVSV